MAINPLQLPSYGSVPQIDFSPLGELGKTFREAEQRRTLADLGRQIESGTIDYNKAAGSLVGMGQLQSGLAMLGQGQTERASQRGAEALGGMFGAPVHAPQQQPAAGGGSNFAGAISSIESGGKYDALGPVTKSGDRAYGKYQVMGANVGPWTESVLGQRMTPQEFASSPQAQDAVFSAKFGEYAQKYGPEGAARAWFAGEGGMNDLGRKDILGTTVGQYGQKFASALGPQQGGGAPQAGSPAPSIPGPQTGLAPTRENIQRALQAAADPKLPQAQREMFKSVFEHLLKASDLPTEQKNYALYRSQGGTDDFTTWDRGNKRSGATAITNDMRGENEYSKQMGKNFAEMNQEIIKSATSARGKIATLDRLDQLMSRPDVYTGAGGDAVLTAKRLAKAVGVDVGDVGGGEAIRAIGNQFALELRNPSGGAGMPGALSDKDREFLQASVPSLQQNPEGNRLIIDYMKRVASRSVDVENLRRQYLKANKGRLDEGFYDILAQYSEANPLFPEAAQAAPGQASAPQSAPGAGGAAAPMPGARQAPDGKWYTPDPQRPGKYLMVQ